MTEKTHEISEKELETKDLAVKYMIAVNGLKTIKSRSCEIINDHCASCYAKDVLYALWELGE